MKRKITLVTFLLFASNFLYAQNINIHSITTGRQPGGDFGYTLDGIHMVDARSKLEDPTNFSVVGTYTKSISIVDAYLNSGDLQAITSASGINIFFFGMFNTSEASLNTFTSGELDSLYAWSVSGGKMILCAGSPIPSIPFTPDALNSRWGFDLAVQYPTQVIPTTAGINSKLFTGPFGNVTLANQGGGSQGYFTVYPANAVILADDNAGSPTMYLDCNTLDLVVADGDTYTDLGGISFGASVSNPNDILWANTIAYMDSLEGPPVITQNGDTLSTGTYSSYQWFLNGSPISGATLDSYVVTQSGNYTVKVPLSCGCTNVASQSFLYVGVGELSAESFFSISPNPSSQQIKIQNSKFRMTIVEIYDAVGKRIISHHPETGISHEVIVDVSELTHGVYFVTMKDEKNNLVTKKIVKM